jgi:hypothetical protein
VAENRPPSQICLLSTVTQNRRGEYSITQLTSLFSTGILPDLTVVQNLLKIYTCILTAT